MARTTSIWALAALSTGILGHNIPKANYTNTAVPQVPHPYWWEGPYSASLVESPYKTPSAIILPTIPSSEEEPCETTSSTAPPPSSSEPCETHTVASYAPVPVMGSYEPASSSSPSSLVVHEPSVSSVYATLPAYPISVGVDSIASTWLPPSYTVAVPFYPSSLAASTWIPPSYTAVVYLPSSFISQETSLPQLSSSEYYSASTAPSVSSSIPLYPGTTFLTPPTKPSSSAYPTYVPSTFRSIVGSSSVALSTATFIIPVPPYQTSGYAPISSLSSSAANTVNLSVSSRPLPTFSLESSISSLAISSVLLSSGVVPLSSSTVVESSSSLVSIPLSTTNNVASAASSSSSLSTPPITVETTLVPSSSTSDLSSISSSAAASATSTKTASQTTRPTAAGSSVPYTLSMRATPSSSAPAETTTDIPPAPPVQTGAANALSSGGNERVWWVSFLLLFIFFV